VIVCPATLNVIFCVNGAVADQLKVSIVSVISDMIVFVVAVSLSFDASDTNLLSVLSVIFDVVVVSTLTTLPNPT